MSLHIRPVESESDYELWREVRLAVMPNERCATVAELMQLDRPERLLLLAYLDGKLAGHGLADRSDEVGRAFVIPRILPAFRQRGVGLALLRVLGEHAAAQGFPVTGSMVEDPESLKFALRLGFTETMRQVEQVRRIGSEPWPTLPDGIEIVSVAQRPELWARAFTRVAVETFQDMALTGTFHATAEEWETEWINEPSAMFLALAEGEVIGLAGLMLDEDRPERAECAYTAVRREWRGKGVAAALKRTSLAWAAENGLAEVYTWTQNGNEDMRRLNEHLGFAYGAVSVSVRAPLPLTGLPPRAESSDRPRPA
jgi:GNAT superfamily N-acetyltransferase